MAGGRVEPWVEGVDDRLVLTTLTIAVRALSRRCTSAVPGVISPSVVKSVRPS